jgi:cephalosporin-C deacetylase-like acetyl esterase
MASGPPTRNTPPGRPRRRRQVLLFLKHRYAFFCLCRRGQGLSADQAPFMQDLLQREESAKGKEARQHLQYILVTTGHLEDALAGLSFLKTAPGIDSKRIAIEGHSFGGVITRLGLVPILGGFQQELREPVFTAVGKQLRRSC